MKRMLTRLFGRGQGVLIVFGVAVSGCATEHHAALDRARVNFLNATRESPVTTYAAADLQDAQQTLQVGERIWSEDENYDEANHLAYLVDRKVELARATAKTATASGRMKALSGEREQAQLQARDVEIERLQEKLQAKRTPEGILVTLGDVLFDTDRAELRPGALQSLYPVVEHLKQHPDAHANIVGHTDDQGSTHYNEALSRRRAEAVMAFLVMNGVAVDRISTRGAGEAYPVVSNGTNAGRQENRRVELTIVDGKQADQQSPSVRVTN